MAILCVKRKAKKGKRDYSLRRKRQQQYGTSGVAVWSGLDRLSQAAKKCSSKCEFFKCGQRALYLSSDRVLCRWADDECAGATCSYAFCMHRHLLTDGTCGMSVKRRTTEEKGPDEVEVAKVKLRGKVLRKLGNDQELL